MFPWSGWGRTDPRWVDAILDWRWTWLAARVALTSPYIVGAIIKLGDLSAATLVGQVAHAYGR